MRKISKYERIFFMNQILLDTKVELTERSVVTKRHAFKLTAYHDHPIVNVTRMNYFLLVKF